MYKKLPEFTDIAEDASDEAKAAHAALVSQQRPFVCIEDDGYWVTEAISFTWGMIPPGSPTFTCECGYSSPETGTWGDHETSTQHVSYINGRNAERERCLAACQLSESETNQLYSAETARYIETKIRKGQ